MRELKRIPPFGAVELPVRSVDEIDDPEGVLLKISR